MGGISTSIGGVCGTLGGDNNKGGDTGGIRAGSGGENDEGGVGAGRADSLGDGGDSSTGDEACAGG